MKLLIMIDMQNDFLTGVLGNEQTADIVPAVCEKLRKYYNETDAPLIYTMDTHEENYLETQEGKKLPAIHCIDGSNGWQLPNELKEIVDSFESRAVCVKKKTFGSRDIPEVIASLEEKYGEKADEIELVGVCTDICVISNALLIKAFYPETPITVDAECCAGITPESHSNALETMKMCQVNIT